MSTDTLRQLTDMVLGASSYREVFGARTNTSEETARQVKMRYRQYVKILHPDVYPESIPHALRDRATEAYKCFIRFHEQATQAVEAGTFGERPPLLTITTKRGTHTVETTYASGDMASTYRGRSQVNGQDVATFIKIARTAADNDLLRVEAKALKTFAEATQGENYRAFTPQLIDTFLVDSGKRLQANTITYLDGFCTLEEVRNTFPRGIDPLDMVWVWRRLLAALGFAHDNGVVHGAVLPQNVMIHPDQHGLVLVDWCYSSIRQDESYVPIQAVVTSRRDWYPDEVFDKKAPSPATDIAMAARTMIYLLAGDPIKGNLPVEVPRPLRAFFRGCLHHSQTARPQNAWLLLREFDELLETMGRPYYPRQFRPFTMPNRA